MYVHVLYMYCTCDMDTLNLGYELMHTTVVYTSIVYNQKCSQLLAIEYSQVKVGNFTNGPALNYLCINYVNWQGVEAGACDKDRSVINGGWTNIEHRIDTAIHWMLVYQHWEWIRGKVHHW